MSTPTSATRTLHAEHPAFEGPAASAAVDLVAIDLDGTLLRSDKNITHRSARAIGHASRAGVKVVLCSARPPRSVREIHTLLGLNTLQTNYNGALIHDRLANRHVHHQPLEGQTALAIIQLARQLEEAVEVSIEVLDSLRTDRHHARIATETSKRFQPDRVAPIEQLIDGPVTKLMLLGLAEPLEPIREAVEQAYGHRVGLMQSDQTLLQYVHPAVNKGQALASVARTYGVERDRVLAIGDAANDVPMLEWAGLGIAVANAWPEAKAAADHIVPTNDDEGVAHAIEKYVLGEV